MIADYGALPMEVTIDNINGLVFGFFFMALSLALFIILLFLRKNERKAIFSLGAAVLSTGVWNIIDYGSTNILSSADLLTMEIIYNIASMVTPIAFAYFFQCIFGTGYRHVIRRLWQIFSVYAVFYISIYLINIAVGNKLSQIAESINSLFFLLIIFEVIVFNVVAVIYAIRGNMDAKIFMAGSSILALSAVAYSVDILAYNRQTFIVSYGIFFFIISLTVLLARHFIDDHRRLESYSTELEVKNRDLNKSRDEVSLLNRTLEERVAERTHQLENINTELKDTLEKLQMTQEQLVESEKMVSLGRLVAGVAHEINTPVGVSVTAASYLDESTREFFNLYNNNSIKKSDLDKYINTCRETTGVIMSNLMRASELIKSFKQVAVDQSSEETRRFSVKKYIDEILLNLRPALKKTRHVVGVNCDENIMLESYPGAFSQIVTNLVMNSLIHAFDEGDEGSIIFDIYKREDNIEIIYSDNGKGIPEDIIKKIFDPFFTTKRGKGGTGLGLNIVYNIITQKLKGSIRCESIPGCGTKFIINIPREKGDSNE